jgi:hypothetical protein
MIAPILKKRQKKNAIRKPLYHAMQSSLVKLPVTNA